jgi:N-acetyl sugar amidotransferase
MTLQTLDKQLQELPDEVIFCKNCVVSNQRPRTVFNAEGVCSACRWAYEKDHVVDWKKREEELHELCNRHRSRDGSFDVVVPGSGGKDSAFTAHQLKHRFGMHPLCVTWAPFAWTEIGWKNLQNFILSGFSNITGHPNGVLHRKLAKLAFELKGDAWEPFAYGQKSWAFNVADKFDISLIFYGENGELEYGGSEKYKYLPKEPPEDWERHYFKGSAVDSLVQAGLDSGALRKEEVSEETIAWYKPPRPEVIEQKKIEMHWLSYYIGWTPQENFYYSAKHTGFETNPEGRSEGTYTKHASLDDRSDGFHFYLQWIKFGMGRASRDAQTDIRRNHITRDEGIALVRRFDGEFPARHYKWFLDYLGIDDAHFWRVMDHYRSQSKVWKREGAEWVMKYPVK